MAIAGKSGKITINGEAGAEQKVMGITNWSLSLLISTLDTTSLGDDWKTYLVGLKEWTASASGNYEVTNASTTSIASQSALQDAFLNGTPVDIKLYVNAEHYYQGTAVIASMTIDDTLEDVVNISFEFTGCGALSFS